MNTEKTLHNGFVQRNDYPIWYYKELELVDVDYVIAYLLKEKFVVEIDGSKHEVTFGLNKKNNYIGQCIKYDDIKKSKLCSYQVINKGFKEGRWFIITDKDTTDEFKQNYEKRKTEHKHEEVEKWYKDVLSRITKNNKDLTNEQKHNYLQKINTEWSFEELEMLMESLMKKAYD